MRTRAELFRQPRIEEKRRGVRLNSRVPVVVEWQDERGTILSESAFTRIIGPYGCMVVLPQDLSIAQVLNVWNSATHLRNSGKVVWKGSQRAEGWELGIELMEPPMDFWGLEF